MCNLIPDQPGDSETTQVSDLKAGDGTWSEEKTNSVNARLRKEAGGATASGGEVARQEGRGQIMKDLVRPGERRRGSSR